ncbi:MAG: hypothetical protein KJO41_04135 [Bacteroidia bacterium]|nr:hypothetical protein [Bacteroidia bacterium]RZW56770.1 MAG: hypothetical protein EX263_01815 [Flavobacteriaceae bacterium]
MRNSKIAKLLGKIVLLLVILATSFFGYLYIKYNDDLPIGEQGVAADTLAHNMLEALNYEAYQNTNYLEWTFRNTNHYKWDKNKGKCEVIWKDFKVILDFNASDNNRAFVHNFEVQDEQANELIDKAVRYFNNDSFWLIAPYKVFDKGTSRQLIRLEDGKTGLLVTYSQGGSTPGDSYLWQFDATGKPSSFRMWTSIIPIQGLKASWEGWITSESGATLSTKHKIAFLTLDMGEVKGTK